jgi:hypothetical protein
LAFRATLVTHHVTSYFLLLCLAVVGGGGDGVPPYKIRAGQRVWGTAVLAAVAILSWMMYVAIITIDYLVPVLSGAVFDLFKVLLRDESGRQLIFRYRGKIR